MGLASAAQRWQTRLLRDCRRGLRLRRLPGRGRRGESVRVRALALLLGAEERAAEVPRLGLTALLVLLPSTRNPYAARVVPAFSNHF